MTNLHNTLFGKTISVLLCWAVLLVSLPIQQLRAAKVQQDSSSPSQAVTTHLEYDGSSNVVARVDGNGNRTEYEYDKVNRLKSIDYPDGNGPEVRFTYDGNGNLTSMTDWTGTTHYTYDILDQLTRVDDSRGNTILYFYDNAGNVIRIACGRQNVEGYPFRHVVFSDANLPAYYVVDHTYDSDNRISSVTDYLSNETTSYAYDKSGNLAQCDLPNGCYILYDYDADGRLIEVENRNAGNGLIAKYEYTLNSIGNRIKVVETTPADSKTTMYTYDLFDRLDTVSYPDGRTVDYDYDNFGNRKTMKEMRGNTMTVTEYFYDFDNRLLYTKVNGIEDEQFSYDAIGNLIRRTSPGESKQKDYTYDHENRLIRYNDSSNDVTYTYNGIGQRVSKSVNGDQTDFLHDAGSDIYRVLAEIDDSGLPARNYTWGDELQSTRMSHNEQSYHYLRDATHGSVSHILDSRGDVANRYEYDAFGSPIFADESIANDYQFLGRNQDDATGLLYLSTQYYDPVLGRSLTRGISLPGLGNQYAITGDGAGGLRPPFYQPPTLGDVGMAILPAVLALEPIAKALGAKNTTALGIAAARIGGWFHALDAGLSAFNLYVQTRDFLCGVAPLGDVDLAARKSAEDWSILLVFLFVTAISIGTLGSTAIVLGGTAATITSVSLKLSDWAKQKGTTILRNLVWRMAFKLIRVPTIPVLDDTEVEDIKDVIDPNWILDPNAPIDPNDPNDFNDNLRIDPDALQFSFWNFNQYGFLPPLPPEPVGGAVSLVGGVTFDKTADILTEINDIKGVIYDKTTGQLVLYGEKDVNLPPMNLDDFIVVARAISLNPSLAPEVSIEPPYVSCEDTGCNEGICATVRYGPIILDAETGEPVTYDIASGTHFGWVMFEADRVLKTLTQGIDNETCEPVTSDVPDFKTMLQRRREHLVSQGSAYARFWFRPEVIRLVPSLDGKSMVFSEVTMRLDSESKYYSDETFHDPAAEDFAQHFNEHYDEFAEEFPIFAELRQLAKIVAVLRWIAENDLPLDLAAFSTYEPTHYDTPFTTPMSNVCQSWLDKDTGQVRLIGVAGGVTYAQDLTIEEASEGSESMILAARPDDTRVPWTVDVEDTEYNAAAIPLTEQTATDGLHLSHTDIDLGGSDAFPLALKRYFNSFDVGPTIFGWGWRAVPFELRLASVPFPLNLNGRTFVGHWFVWYIDRTTGTSSKYVIARCYSESLDPPDIAAHFGIDEEIFVYVNETQPEAAKLFVGSDGAFTMRQDRGALLDFDSSGQLIRIKDPRGSEVSFLYDAGRLTNISDPMSSRRILLSYDDKGQVTAAEAPGVKRIAYTYDAFTNDLIAVRDLENGNVRTLRLMNVAAQAEAFSGTAIDYGYDKDHRVVKVEDVMNQSLAEFEYNEVDQVTAATHLRADTGLFSEYDSGDHTTRITGPEEFSIVVQHDPNSNLAYLTDSQGHVTTWKYNDHQEVISQTNAEGYTAEFYYDGDKRLMAVKWPNERIDAVIRNEYGYPHQFFWTESGQGFEENFDPNHHWIGGGKLSGYVTAKFEYAGAGILAKVIDARQEEHGFDYADGGNAMRFLNGEGYGTDYHYDGNSRLVEVRNEMGHAVSFDYDEQDNLTAVATEAGNVELTYDAQDRLHSIIYGDPDARRSYRYEYNANSQLQTVTSPDGTVTSYVYDVSGNLIQVIHDKVVRFEYEYDDLNRIIQIRYFRNVSSEVN